MPECFTGLIAGAVLRREQDAASGVVWPAGPYSAANPAPPPPYSADVAPPPPPCSAMPQPAGPPLCLSPGGVEDVPRIESRPPPRVTPPAERATEGPAAGDETMGPLADDETRGPLAADNIAALRPTGGRRAARALEAHGLATLAEVRSHGVLVGFGITCRCHNNVDDRPGIICKKQLPLGNPPMSHVEAKLRLKRWYVAGSQETWDPHTARTSHIKFGGRNLRDLDSRAEGWATITEWDLSDMARRRGAP